MSEEAARWITEEEVVQKLGVIVKFLVWAAEGSGTRHREPARFCRRRGSFQVAVRRGEGRMSHVPFGPVADCFSLWARSSCCSVEQAESS